MARGGKADVTDADHDYIKALYDTTISDSAYEPDCDLDRDGKITDADNYYLDTYQLGLSGLETGAVGSTGKDYQGNELPWNSFGFCGYVYAPEAARYCVRNRWYDAGPSLAMGRWLQRDPAGYVDGMNLFEYCASGPVGGCDPMGLAIFDKALTRQETSSVVGAFGEEVRVGFTRVGYGAFTGVREIGYLYTDAIGFGRDLINGTNTWSPRSQVGKKSADLAESNASTHQTALLTKDIAVSAGETLFTAGLNQLARGSIDWYKTGDPAEFQEGAGVNFLFTMAFSGSAFRRICPSEPNPGGPAGKTVNDASSTAPAPDSGTGTPPTPQKPVSPKASNRLRPDPNASGSHTTFRRDPNTGRVSHYQTWEPQTNPQDPKPWVPARRFDLTGNSHYNKVTGQDIPTPHMHDPAAPGGVRPAEPEEIPK